ncbi:MAG: sulfotransferase family protein [Bacteroidota bacterium]
MKVFGIGLIKTGTTSLGKALEILGFNPHISYDEELMNCWMSSDFNPIYKASDRFVGFEDWPWLLMYKEMFHRYPDAKFILTQRANEEVWYKSVCKHALKVGPTEIRKHIFGYYMPHDSKEEHIAVYRKHNQDVVDFFTEHAPERLIVVSWDGDGDWEKICGFLGKKVPNREFPFLNKAGTKPSFFERKFSRENLRKKLDQLLNR